MEKPAPRLVSSVISVKNDFMTPKLPERNPLKTRPITAWVYVSDNPNTMVPIPAPIVPVIVIIEKAR